MVERLKSVIAELKHQKLIRNQQDFVERLGYNKSSVSQILNGRVPLSEQFVLNVCKVFKSVNPQWILTGEGEMLLSSFSEPKSELKAVEFSTHLEVKVVTTKARAGYSESYYADEYLEDMPTVLIEADKEYRGKYLAFEVDGDSMEPEYHPGDVVICREIKRDLWKYRLHIEDWDFVIAHGIQGIMLKQIIDHDVATGDIVCHSVNSEGHPDFVLNLREVAFLYNVVEHRISGKNKRRYR